MQNPFVVSPLRLASISAAALALTVAASIPVHSQTRSLSWTETTRLEVPGSLGLILRMVGGSDPIVARSALHLQGRAMIQDYDQTTFVTDLDAGRWITVDHEARTYTTLSFEEMGQLSEQAIEQAYAAASASPEAADLQESREELRQALEEAQAEIRFRVSAETTGARQRIGAYNATQHFVVTEFEVTAVPEGVEQREGGSMYFLAELWQTSEVPAEHTLYEDWARTLATDPRFRDMADDMMTAAADGGEMMATALAAWDPAVGAGLAQMAEAMEEIDGTTVRSVITVALVPLGVTPDRAALIAWEPASMGGQLRGAAGDVARQAAADAVGGAIRGLGRGLLGGGNRAPEPEPTPAAAAEPTVQPFFRMVTTRDDLAYRESNEDVLGALNTRIADYRAITFADLSRQLQ